MATQDSSRSRAASFARIEVRAPDRDLAERLEAEAYEAGAVGLEEREGEGGGIALSVYAPAEVAHAVAAALRSQAQSRARVADPEPLPPDSPLWATPNLIITPHVSSDDAERYIPLTLDLFFDNLRRLVAGRPLRNRVDVRRGY